MENNNFLPESKYCLDPEMDRSKLKPGDVVTGWVSKFDYGTNSLTVELGNNLIATMPIEESTIYKIYRPGGTFISANVYLLIGKNIRAEVISIDDGKIIISRKQHMEKAVELLKDQTVVSDAVVTSYFNRIYLFVDIGAGVLALIKSKELYPCYFTDIKETGIKPGDSFDVIISYDNDTQRFTASRLQALTPFVEVLNPGDIVQAKVFDAKEFYVNDRGNTIYSYYVAIMDNYPGILDSPIPISQGTMVTIVIKSLSKKGARTRLIYSS